MINHFEAFNDITRVPFSYRFGIYRVEGFTTVVVGSCLGLAFFSLLILGFIPAVFFAVTAAVLLLVLPFKFHQVDRNGSFSEKNIIKAVWATMREPVVVNFTVDSDTDDVITNF